MSLGGNPGQGPAPAITSIPAPQPVVEATAAPAVEATEVAAPVVAPPTPVLAVPESTGSKPAPVRAAPRQTRRRTTDAPVTPVAKPDPVQLAEQALGAADPQSKPKTEPDAKAPEGYMGMPDDLIE